MNPKHDNRRSNETDRFTPPRGKSKSQRRDRSTPVASDSEIELHDRKMAKAKIADKLWKDLSEEELPRPPSSERHPLDRTNSTPIPL